MSNWIQTTTQRFIGASILLLATVAPAFCNTWIVDQANGPGTNFTSIPPAIAASVAGDVIIVRAGQYGPFTLGAGVSIIGQGTVNINGYIDLSAVPAGDVAVLYNIDSPFGYSIRVNTCAGTVLLQNLLGPMEVNASTDVRVQESTSGSPFGVEGIKVTDSRVQIVQSNFQGGKGWDANCAGGIGSDGFSGVLALGHSRVHFSLSTARGGVPGFDAPFCGMQGGNPGSGMAAYSAAPANPVELILTGSGIGRLSGGPWNYGGPDAGPSLELVDNVNAWTSGMTYTPSGPASYGQGNTLIILPPTEPTLEVIGVPSPGGTITLRLRAEPGTAVRLNLGSTPILAPQPGILVEGLVLKQRSFDRGLVPASGVLDTIFPFHPAAPIGKRLIFQGKVTNPVTGLTQKSNSIEAIIP